MRITNTRKDKFKRDANDKKIKPYKNNTVPMINQMCHNRFKINLNILSGEDVVKSLIIAALYRYEVVRFCSFISLIRSFFSHDDNCSTDVSDVISCISSLRFFWLKFSTFLNGTSTKAKPNTNRGNGKRGKNQIKKKT